MAQDEAPRNEVFAGYSFLRDQEIKTNFPVGWDLSYARNLNNSLGIVADVGGNYKSEAGATVSVHAFLAGVRLSRRGETIAPYVEALVGVARAGASGGGQSSSSSDLAVQGGVGLGFKVKENVWVRAGGDFRNIFGEGGSTQEFRAVAGVTFGFGGSRRAAARREPLAGSAGSQGFQEPSPLPPAAAPRSAPRTPPDEGPAPPSQGQRPAPTTPAAPPTSPDALARGQASLRAGNYLDAGAAYREHLQARASYKVTIPVGVYCDATNIAQQVGAAGNSTDLIVLRLTRRGQTCYGLYWGLFETTAEAQAALDRLPAGLRTAGQQPMAVSRILARLH